MTDRTITEIPLDAIVEHPDQPRYGVGDVKALADSIENAGLLEPIIVAGFEANADGPAGYRVLSGHRRVAAMRHLGRTEIPAVELAAMISGGRSPDVKALDEIAAIMASNTAREALTPLEEARGYQTMLDLGVKPEMVARISGTKKKHVEGLAGAAAALGDHVDELAGVQLTVEEMETLARHAGNKTAYKKLVAELGKSGFEWAARTADQAKRKAEMKAAVKAIVEAAGVELVKEFDFYSGGSIALHYLVDAEGDEIDPAVHNSTCPGAVATFHSYGASAETAVEWGCRGWEEHGHQRRGGWEQAELTPEEVAEREERARREEAWSLAETLRREFEAGLVAQKTIPGALFIGAAPLAWNCNYYDWGQAAELLGWGETNDWKLKGTQQATHAFTALGLAAGEDCIDDFASRMPGNKDQRERTVAYLRLLEAQGYELHEPELDFIARCVAADKEPTPVCGAASCAGCGQTTSCVTSSRTAGD